MNEATVSDDAILQCNREVASLRQQPMSREAEMKEMKRSASVCVDTVGWVTERPVYLAGLV